MGKDLLDLREDQNIEGNESANDRFMKKYKKIVQFRNAKVSKDFGQ